MVIEAKRQFSVTSCNCGSVFQGDRFRKHVQGATAKGQKGHSKEVSVHYCAKCNVWGEENEVFKHPDCPRLSFTKADLRLIVKKVAPLARLELLKAKEEKDVKAAVAAIESAAEGLTDKEVPAAEGPSDERELAAAVASIQPAEKIKADAWADAFGPPLSEDSDEEFNPPKRRRHIVDLDDTRLTETPSPRTSTPTKPLTQPSPPPSTTSKSAHLPRKTSEHINIVFQHNKIKDENHRLKKTIANLNQEIGIYKGKETLNKRLTEDVQRKNEQIAQMEALIKREREEREEERKSRDETAKKEKETYEAEIQRLKNEWAKERARLTKRETDKDHVLIHCELINNRMNRRHAETSPDASTCCYSNEAAGAHCLHIEVSGRDTFTKVRNVRWPSGKSKEVE